MNKFLIKIMTRPKIDSQKVETNNKKKVNSNRKKVGKMIRMPN